MKYAIKLLTAELNKEKYCLKLTASTELKMQIAGKIDELEKSIKAVKQHDKIFALLKRLKRWADSSITSVSQEAWMKEEDAIFEQIKKIIGEAGK